MLTIVIVSFNSARTLQVCQDELLASGQFPIIVVDNASRDGSADMISERYPHIRIIRMAHNEGYGRAANRAFAEVKTPYAFLLNPDMQATNDNIQAMLEFALRHKGEASLFAPAVVEKDYVKEGAASRAWLIGAALLFKMQDFSEVGFFDENIFLFSEETDLCRRLVVSGKQIYLNTDIYVHHLAGQSSTPNPKIDALKNWHFGWSKMYYLQKHGLVSGWWQPRRLCLGYALKRMVAVHADKRRQYAARLAGMRACLRGEGAFLPDGRAQGSAGL